MNSQTTGNPRVRGIVMSSTSDSIVLKLEDGKKYIMSTIYLEDNDPVCRREVYYGDQLEVARDVLCPMSALEDRKDQGRANRGLIREDGDGIGFTTALTLFSLYY